ncbi:MAG: hypothetical protein LBT25_01690 [Candidatus Symbiothrix sp.]|jgi:hypothetical protein|nr:hypothetical protein [Candidatus Symbiothrix sp.]
MRKLVLFAAFVALVGFSACSNKAKEEAPEAPVEQVVEEIVVEETVAPEVTDSAATAPAEEAPVQ